MAAKPSRDELAQLDKPALVELMVQLLDKIEQLEAQLPPPAKPPTKGLSLPAKWRYPKGTNRTYPTSDITAMRTITSSRLLLLRLTGGFPW